MVPVAGTYQFVENVNPEGMLKIAGKEVTERSLAGVNEKNSKIIVQADGDQYNFTTTIGDSYKRELKFTLGKVFEENDDRGNKTNTTVTRDGDKFKFESSKDGKNSVRFYEFTTDGVTMVLNVGDGTVAKRIYKRV